ncbi:MAG: hypothetical protein ACO323_05480, partial [Candidatus Kapaibacteriota bacterium]
MMQSISIRILFLSWMILAPLSFVMAQEFYPKVYSASGKFEEVNTFLDKKFNRILKVRRSSFLIDGNSQIQIVKKFSQNVGKSLSFPFPIDDIISIQEQRLLISVDGEIPRLLLIDLIGKVISKLELPLSSTYKKIT